MQQVRLGYRIILLIWVAVAISRQILRILISTVGMVVVAILQ